MNVDVYDTYATSSAGRTMHFDVLVPSDAEADTAYQFALQWLEKIGASDARLSQERCRFCHQEIAVEHVVADIRRDGYHIIAMEGCPPIGD